MKFLLPFAFASLRILLLSSRAEENVDFGRDVRPILERSCVKCHGPEKQKGNLRLDTREGLLKGGENGAAVEAGNAAKSELLRRAALKETDEDVMPPKGKVDHLTSSEIEKLTRWIADGANWPSGLVVVAKLDDAAGITAPPASQEELAARTALMRSGVRVAPIAAGTNWVRISFRGAREVTQKTFVEVGKVANAVELDLGGTKCRDEDLRCLDGMVHLSILNLAETSVTDAAIDYVGRLPKLASLNLFGTRITDAGASKLAGAGHLKRLYLAGTQVSATAVDKLKEALPGLFIEHGDQFAELVKPLAPAEEAKK